MKNNLDIFKPEYNKDKVLKIIATTEPFNWGKESIRDNNVPKVMKPMKKLANGHLYEG